MAIGTWFATDYDVPATALELPLVVTGGQQAGVCVVDQVMRGSGIVGRVIGDFGAVGLQVRGAGHPVRVAVSVRLDEVATRWWSDRVRPGRSEPERPRLVVVRSQGEVRGAAVLARRQGWRRAGDASATVEFDLAAADVDSDGLLVIELAEPPLPAWAARRLSACGALGLRIDQITAAARPAPAGGTPPAPAADGTGCAFAVIPAGRHTEFHLALRPVAPAPPVRRSPTRRGARRKPARAVFKLLRTGRRAAVHVAGRPFRVGSLAGVGVQGADLVTGEPVDVEVVRRDGAVLHLRLAASPAGPVLVGVTGTSPDVSCRVTPTAPTTAATGMPR